MPAALHGLRVLELATGVSGPYCGMLAGLGANVIKLEPPAGDVTRVPVRSPGTTPIEIVLGCSGQRPTHVLRSPFLALRRRLRATRQPLPRTILRSCESSPESTQTVWQCSKRTALFHPCHWAAGTDRSKMDRRGAHGQSRSTVQRSATRSIARCWKNFRRRLQQIPRQKRGYCHSLTARDLLDGWFH